MFEQKYGIKVETIRNKYKTMTPNNLKTDSIPQQNKRLNVSPKTSLPFNLVQNIAMEQRPKKPDRTQRTGKICRNSIYQKQNNKEAILSMQLLPLHNDYTSVNLKKRTEKSSALSSKIYKQDPDFGYKTQRTARKRSYTPVQQPRPRNLSNPKLSMDSAQCIRKIQQVQQKIKSLLFSK